MRSVVANVLEYLQGIVPDILTRSEMQILAISRLLPYFPMLVSQFSHHPDHLDQLDHLDHPDHLELPNHLDYLNHLDHLDHSNQSYHSGNTD